MCVDSWILILFWMVHACAKNRYHWALCFAVWLSRVQLGINCPLSSLHLDIFNYILIYFSSGLHEFSVFWIKCYRLVSTFPINGYAKSTLIDDFLWDQNWSDWGKGWASESKNNSEWLFKPYIGTVLMAYVSTMYHYGLDIRIQDPEAFLLGSRMQNPGSI